MGGFNLSRALFSGIGDRAGASTLVPIMVAIRMASLMKVQRMQAATSTTTRTERSGLVEVCAGGSLPEALLRAATMLSNLLG